MATMNISLPDKLKAFVEERVAEGSYANVSDYVRDVLRKEQARQAAISEIRQAIKEGEESGFAPFDPDVFFDQLLAREPRDAA